MLMSWADSMVTCWRLIKSPWVGKKITYANTDRKNKRTKEKATKFNILLRLKFSIFDYIVLAHETT